MSLDKVAGWVVLVAVGWLVVGTPVSLVLCALFRRRDTPPQPAAPAPDPVDAHFDTAVREPVPDVSAVLADDLLLDLLKAGEEPPPGEVNAMLAAWVTDCWVGRETLDEIGGTS